MIKLFISDVDGVLTDGSMYYSENGNEIKKFSTYDGMGFVLLKKRGIKIYKYLFSLKIVINLIITLLIYKSKQINSNYFIVQYFKKNNKFGICNYPNISAIYFIDMNV